LGACGGMRCALRCGRIVADATGRSPQAGQQLALEFLAQGARRRSAAVGAAQARQEALSLSALQAEIGTGSRDS
jgi:glycerol-3-phosphate dehydrogenase